MNSRVSISPTGEVWGLIGQSNSLWSPARFDGTSWKVVIDEEGNTPSFWLAMTPFVFDAEGNAWMGSDWGATRFDGQNWKLYKWSETGGNAYSVAIAPNGDVWCGSDYGNVYRLRDEVWTQFRVDDVFNWVGSIAVTPDGTVWAGLTQAGYYRFNGSSWEAAGPAGNFDSRSVLAVDREGALWAVAEGGVARFDGTTWKTYTPADGLVSAGIQSITAAEDGAVWIATSNGASRFQDGEWKSYTTANGLPSNDLRSIAIAGDDLLWFGTDQGLFLFGSESTSVESEQMIPVPFTIRGNSPNPFNPSTTISFALPAAGPAELTVYSITGQKVRTLLSCRMEVGAHSALWNGRDDAGKPVSSGVYIARLWAGKSVSSHKMLLMK